MKIQDKSFYPTIHKPQTNFKATVHILDNGTHANGLCNFAKAVFKNNHIVDNLQLHRVELHPKYEGVKMLDSVEDKLKELLSSDKLKQGDYLTFLGLMTLWAENITDGIKDVLGKNIKIDANNIKTNKDIIMKLLQKLCFEPQKYLDKFDYMDDYKKRNVSHTYNVIQLINQLQQKGVRVFLPAGHGAEHAIKNLIKQNELSNELYKYIATGVDTDNAIQNIFKEADRQNCYKFNLLSLCNANIVNINDRYGKNFIFSSRDGFATTSSRGVFNFTPIRNKNGTVLGYSFHDTKTVEIPDEEFAGRDTVQDLNKFVGLPVTDLISDDKENLIFKKLVKKGLSTNKLPNKLYPITEVFDENIINAKKMKLLGCLTNREQDKIFDINPQGQIVFQKTNCEGSDRPSVVSMWGTCFATVNSIAEHIKNCRKTD